MQVKQKFSDIILLEKLQKLTHNCQARNFDYVQALINIKNVTLTKEEVIDGKRNFSHIWDDIKGDSSEEQSVIIQNIIKKDGYLKLYNIFHTFENTQEVCNYFKLNHKKIIENIKNDFDCIEKNNCFEVSGDIFYRIPNTESYGFEDWKSVYIILTNYLNSNTISMLNVIDVVLSIDCLSQLEPSPSLSKYIKTIVNIPLVYNIEGGKNEKSV